MKRRTYMQKKHRKEAIRWMIICNLTIIFLVAAAFIERTIRKYENQIDSMQAEHDAAFAELNNELVEANERNPEFITVLVEAEQQGPSVFKHLELDVNVLLQQPELPAGCEVTSLTACMNFLGFDVDKVDMARLLPQGPIKATDPDVAFVGNPEQRGSYGCNAPVIVNTANKWLEENTQDVNMKAYDLTGHEFKDLLSYIEKGYPVIIWGTEYMKVPTRTTTWQAGDKTITWKYGFHCLVLIGWNEDGYIIMDPILGMKTYPVSDVHTCYEAIGKQAVVLQPNDLTND